MKTTQTVLALLCALGLTLGGCIGDVSNDPADDEEVVEDPPPDPPAPIATSITGMVTDYQLLATGLTLDPILAEASLATEGLDPQLLAVTIDGAYAFEEVPVTSRFSVLIDGLTGFYPTINYELIVGDQPIEDRMLYAVSNTYIAGTFNADNGIIETLTLGSGQVFVELNKNNGDPFVDPQITAESITLIDPAAPEIEIVPSVYFVAATTALPVDGGDGTTAGYPTANVLTPELDPSGKAHVALLNVDPGTYDLKVSYLNGAGDPMEQLTPITVVADSVTLARTGGGGGGGNGEGGGNGPGIALPADGVYGFVEDVYPRLQKTTLDPAGDGCANCHSEGGDLEASAAIQYNLEAQLVYDAIIGGALIDLAAPVDSILVVNPTKGLLGDHPTKIWSTVPGDLYYESYLATLTWIEQGAPLTRADNLTPPIVDGGGGGGGGGGGAGGGGGGQ